MLLAAAHGGLGGRPASRGRESAPHHAAQVLVGERLGELIVERAVRPAAVPGQAVLGQAVLGQQGEDAGAAGIAREGAGEGLDAGQVGAEHHQIGRPAEAAA